MFGPAEDRDVLYLSIRSMRTGVHAKRVHSLAAALGVTKEALYLALNIGGTTVEKKVAAGGRLNPSQSERVLGLEALIDVVRESGIDLGEHTSIAAWLGEWLQCARIDQDAPIELLDTVTGQRIVAAQLRALGRRTRH